MQMTRSRRNPDPVPPGDGPAPSAASTTRAVRSSIPSPATTPDESAASLAVRLVPAPAAAPALPASPAGGAGNKRQYESPAGGAGNGRHGDDDDSQDSILSPEDINASRWEGDNASRNLAGQVLVQGFDKNSVSFCVQKYVCRLTRFLDAG